MKITANGITVQYDVEGPVDRGTDITMARAMHQRIAGSELHVIPGAAHCSCVEAAAEFNRALLEFLHRVHE